ncbi:MAG: exo-alpha-sialidase [Mesorhizobium sp.]|uniref:WD40/YVTN/BNR-like repeat-containing protein n=1 Tax=unclassified Mesorhizobium TaxID=325217 RepID=UPI000FCB28C7|nr:MULTISPECIES: exo-alpha-sialidase [unclassified Mesorhizobium]RUV61541.1 exo-alpha-sialidase [Mesorhizobium sp. M5C.F.Ca.IN.020.14.1.1]RUV28216.1 exo-alpha-sialidase [Mesorhizobium sp. M5C.F.Ca.IN.020.32.2.1]RUV59556.1 exo-alpha-sialidase [Mesorhizobium sp. M5C.F.Ca.IN.020.29.1.1]RWD47254.1 MAG: exo-alpha-sialidase [Mesorhizobium sp.]RWE07822.1 MAG: exo-alpha-sialidase [Mesorhizobium sp.]
MRQLLGILVASLIAATSTGSTAGAEAVSVSQLKERTHIHGLAVDRENSQKLLIATHHGLFRAGSDGKAELISPVQDFMGFTPDPSDPRSLYASGHPAGGGNLGFIASTDNGATWTQIAPGADGPVDFHQMTVSSADPQVLYGAYGGLQVSRDAGKTWSVVGLLPEKLIDLAASAKDADTIYAATEGGLSVSRNGGLIWETVVDGAPVSLVEVTADGSVYAFVVGRGLVRSAEAALNFAPLSSGLSDRILLHLAVDPADKDRIFVASHQGDILASTDGGVNWTELGR